MLGGILAGLGEAAAKDREQQAANNRNLLTAAAENWRHISENPNISPEGLQHAVGTSILLTGTNPYDSKAVKQALKQGSDLTPIHEGMARPPMQIPSRQIEAQNMPIAAEIPPPMPRTVGGVTTIPQSDGAQNMPIGQGLSGLSGNIIPALDKIGEIQQRSDLTAEDRDALVNTFRTAVYPYIMDKYETSMETQRRGKVSPPNTGATASIGKRFVQTVAPALPSLAQIQGGAVPTLDQKPVPQPAMQTPPPSTFTAPPITAPLPNAGFFETEAQQLAKRQRLGELDTQLAAQKAGAVAKATEQSRLDIILAQHGFKNLLDASKAGFKAQTDSYGNPTLVPMGEADMSATQKADIALKTSRKQLADAEAEYNRLKANPDSPVYTMAKQRLEVSKRNAAVAEANAGLRNKDQLARFYGIDINGNALPGAPIDPVTGLPTGTAYARFVGPTSATLTKVQSAGPVISQGNSLIDFASDPDHEHVFGIGGGLAKWTAGKIGTNDPALSGLGAQIESLSSLLTTLHGARGAALAKGFKETLQNVNSPEAFAEAVRQYVDTAQRIQQITAPNPPPAGATKAPPAAGDVKKAADDLIKGILKPKGTR